MIMLVFLSLVVVVLLVMVFVVVSPNRRMQADALQPEQWRWALEGALGVVSCVGAFGSNDYMLKVCHCFVY